MFSKEIFCRTITLFNLHGNTWHPTVLHNCCLISDKAARQAATGLENADSASLYILPESVEEAGVEVVGPKAYDSLSDPAGYISFHEGTDFFAEGEYEEESVDDDEYKSGYYSHLNKTRDGIHLITSAARYDLIPHWEIIGK